MLTVLWHGRGFFDLLDATKFRSPLQMGKRKAELRAGYLAGLNEAKCDEIALRLFSGGERLDESMRLRPAMTLESAQQAEGRAKGGLAGAAGWPSVLAVSE